MWYVYIILCDQKTFYVGITNDLESRMDEHKKKKSFFTSKFSDLRLVYRERFVTKSQAVLREKQLKGWSRKKKQLLIEGALH